MHPIFASTIAAVALAACAGGHAANVVATPATVQSVLADARGGDTITLAPGSYAPIRLRGKDWTPSVTVEAGKATLAGVSIAAVSGLTWRGGRFDGNDTERNGFKAEQGARIVVEKTTMVRFVRNGVGFGQISDGRIAGNLFDGMGSDGIDVALSRRIVVDDNECRDSRPTPGAHPDCIQLWSRPTVPPTADITITNNRATGDTQGISLFNHVRDGVDDGGFDRIRIAGNVLKVMQWHGIFVDACRDCVVRDNRVETIPNGRIKAWIKFGPTSTVTACGNVATAWPEGEGSKACAKS